MIPRVTFLFTCLVLVLSKIVKADVSVSSSGVNGRELRKWGPVHGLRLVAFLGCKLRTVTDF